MLAEFTIINDPLRPSICTNLCSVCYRNNEHKKIGCCSYEPEFCLFDLAFLYLYYPDIYELILKNGQIIKGYNGIMLEMKTGLNQCPFVCDIGCVLPKDALPPLCRLYICRQAAIFGPAIIEEKFDEYFSSKEYQLNNLLNSKLIYDQDFTRHRLHNFITEISQTVNTMISGINRINLPIESFKREINIVDFGSLL
ncbi:hypothetical protein [Desulfosporosinus sp. OT]|uniref:hypothetical protein n=1 Tax=Desulfosporosinus sp. OT TaxID=913865 RepID=UPI000223A6C2|nr:hypothetical protein [Desulfosporosinus sp. OT]EGW41897.1 hypothetical protein DOT_0107 [Desulfosporosinus sp. OT]